MGPKMTHLSWTKFFWYKPLLLLSSTYWPFSLRKVLKTFLQQIQSYKDLSFLGPKWFICPKQNLFLKKIIKIIFIYLLAPFNRQNFKKILRANPELWACAMFGPKIPQFVLNKTFWYKPLLLLSSTYWSFSFGKIKKKNILTADAELWGCAIFWTQNGSFAPNKNLFGRLSISLSPTFKTLL